MFSNIFQTHSSHVSDDDATTYTVNSLKSNETPKSILRRQGSERNSYRSVSWSATYETFEHDISRDSLENPTFETRDDETPETRKPMLVLDNTAILEDSFKSGAENDESRLDTLKSQERNGQTMITITQSDSISIETEVSVEATPIVDNNENLELRNIACAASNVTEASEWKDKYGCNEKDAKRGQRISAAESYVSEGEPLFGDKYHGFDDEPVADADMRKQEVVTLVSVPGQMETTPEPAAAIEGGNSIPQVYGVRLDQANIFVPGEVTTTLQGDAIQDIPCNDSLTIGSLSEEQVSQSFEYESNKGGLKANSDEGSMASLKKSKHGYEDIFKEQSTADKRMGHIGLILPFLSQFQCGVAMDGASMLDDFNNKVTSENLSIEDKVKEDDVFQKVHGVSLDDETKVVSAAEEQVKQKEFDTYEKVSECQVQEDVSGILKASTDETSVHSMELPDEKSQTSGQIENVGSQYINGIVGFSVADDNSIRSNDNDNEFRKQGRQKARFKPLTSLRKGVSLAASKYFRKSRKKQPMKGTQSKMVPMSTQLYTVDTLHDKVYHKCIPTTHAHVSIELILDDLKMIENTAKVMYQDRFSSSNPSLLDADIEMIR